MKKDEVKPKDPAAPGKTSSDNAAHPEEGKMTRRQAIRRIALSAGAGIAGIVLGERAARAGCLNFGYTDHGGCLGYINRAIPNYNHYYNSTGAYYGSYTSYGYYSYSGYASSNTYAAYGSVYDYGRSGYYGSYSR